MSTKYDGMSGPELVEAYNKMAEEKGYAPVQRFSSTAKGIERCVAMEGYRQNTGDTPADTKPKKSATKPSKEKDGSLLSQFEAREGTIRKKVLEELLKNLGSQVKVRALIAKSYGADSEKGKSAIFMVIKGIDMMIEKHHIKVKLKRERDEKKEVSYGLYES